MIPGSRMSFPLAAVIVTGLSVSETSPSRPVPAPEANGFEARQLKVVLQAFEREADWPANTDKAMVIEGARNFFRPFPAGNGRSCATCHNPADGFSLSPATVAARWQALERARRTDPDADDPLFRALDADDGREDFTLLRSRALIKVRVPLPANVRLTDDPAAVRVTVSRAVPPLNMLKHTAPYQQDRSAATLEEQARNAVNQHLEPRTPPTQRFLDTVAAFERHIFSSPAVKRLSRAIDAGSPLPVIEPALDRIERLGKEKFDDFCGRCHGGPAQVSNLENRIFPPFDGSTNPASLNVVISNPPPPEFPPSVLHRPDIDLPTRRFTIAVPGSEDVVLESSDPGTVLTDEQALELVGGNRVFNRFDIPPLYGINQTAPYFHDHRAATLEEVVRHYQSFFRFINRVRGFPLPLIPDEDVEPIVAYMRKAF